MRAHLRISLLDDRWERTGEALELDGDTQIAFEWVSPLLDMRPSYAYDFTVPATPANLRMLGDLDARLLPWAEASWHVAMDGLPLYVEGRMRCADYGQGRITLSFQGVNRFWDTADALPLGRVTFHDGPRPADDDKRLRLLYEDSVTTDHPVALSAGHFLERCVAACGATLTGHERVGWMWLGHPEAVFIVPERRFSVPRDGTVRVRLHDIRRPVGEWLRALCAQLGVRLWVDRDQARLISLDEGALSSPVSWLGTLGYTQRVSTSLGAPLQRLATARRDVEDAPGPVAPLGPVEMHTGFRGVRISDVSLMQPARWPGEGVKEISPAVDMFHYYKAHDKPEYHGSIPRPQYVTKGWPNAAEGRTGHIGSEFVIGGEVFRLLHDGGRLMWEHRGCRAPYIFQGEGDRIACPFWRGQRRWVSSTLFERVQQYWSMVRAKRFSENPGDPPDPGKPRPPDQLDPEHPRDPSPIWLPPAGQRLFAWSTLPVSKPTGRGGNLVSVPWLFLAVSDSTPPLFAVLREPKPAEEPRLFLRRGYPGKARPWAEGKVFAYSPSADWVPAPPDYVPDPDDPSPQPGQGWGDKVEGRQWRKDWRLEPSDALGEPYEPERGTGYPVGLMMWLWWHHHALQGPLEAWDDFQVLQHLYDWPRPDAGEIPTQRILRAAFTIGPTSLTVDRVDAVQWWALPRVYMKRFFEQNFDFGEPAKPGSRSR